MHYISFLGKNFKPNVFSRQQCMEMVEDIMMEVVEMEIVEEEEVEEMEVVEVVEGKEMEVVVMVEEVVTEEKLNFKAKPLYMRCNRIKEIKADKGR